MDESEILGRDIGVELMLKMLFGLIRDAETLPIRDELLAAVDRLRDDSQIKDDERVWATAKDVIDRVLS